MQIGLCSGCLCCLATGTTEHVSNYSTLLPPCRSATPSAAPLISHTTALKARLIRNDCGTRRRLQWAWPQMPGMPEMPQMRWHVLCINLVSFCDFSSLSTISFSSCSSSLVRTKAVNYLYFTFNAQLRRDPSLALALTLTHTDPTKYSYSHSFSYSYAGHI